MVSPWGRGRAQKREANVESLGKEIRKLVAKKEEIGMVVLRQSLALFFLAPEAARRHSRGQTS